MAHFGQFFGDPASKKINAVLTRGRILGAEKRSPFLDRNKKTGKERGPKDDSSFGQFFHKKLMFLSGLASVVG